MGFGVGAAAVVGVAVGSGGIVDMAVSITTGVGGAVATEDGVELLFGPAHPGTAKMRIIVMSVQIVR